MATAGAGHRRLPGRERWLPVKAVVDGDEGLTVADAAFEAVGATLGDAAAAFGADLVLKVVAPSDDEAALMKAGAVLVGMLNPFSNETIARLNARGLTAFALEAAGAAGAGVGAAARAPRASTRPAAPARLPRRTSRRVSGIRGSWDSVCMASVS